MGNNNAGVLVTQNEPSTLTREEKILRRQTRALEHELAHQQQRVRRFEVEAQSKDPVQQAAAVAELQLAKERAGECEAALAELQLGAVN